MPTRNCLLSSTINCQKNSCLCANCFSQAYGVRRKAGEWPQNVSNGYSEVGPSKRLTDTKTTPDEPEWFFYTNENATPPGCESTFHNLWKKIRDPPPPFPVSCPSILGRPSVRVFSLFRKEKKKFPPKGIGICSLCYWCFPHQLWKTKTVFHKPIRPYKSDHIFFILT